MANPGQSGTFQGRRVVVVGDSCSGKTTTARRLATMLQVPHIELDALFWDPNWTQAPADVFRSRVDAALRGEAWVADGNYSVARDLIWGRADTIVWLDFPLPLVLSRMLRRTTRRLLSREELWNGNRDRLAYQFTRDSLFLWTMQTHGRRKRAYTTSLLEATPSHLTVVHLRSPRESARWLQSISSPGITPARRDVEPPDSENTGP